MTFDIRRGGHRARRRRARGLRLGRHAGAYHRRRPTASAVSDLFWLGGPPGDADAGGDPPDGPVVLEPPPGGCSVRHHPLPGAPSPGTPGRRAWIRVDGDDPAPSRACTRPTRSTSWSSLDGEIVLGLDDGEHRARPRRRRHPARHRAPVARHRRQARASTRCSCCAPTRRLPPRPSTLCDPCGSRSGARPSGPRRLVTAHRRRRPVVRAQPTAPRRWCSSPPDRAASRWSSCGRPAGGWPGPTRAATRPAPGSSNRAGAGIAFRYVEMPAGHDPGDGGWHTTATHRPRPDAVGPARARASPGRRSGRRRPARVGRAAGDAPSMASGRRRARPLRRADAHVAIGD